MSPPPEPKDGAEQTTGEQSAQYRLYVVEALSELKSQLRTVQQEMSQIKVDIAVLQTKTAVSSGNMSVALQFIISIVTALVVAAILWLFTNKTP